MTVIKSARLGRVTPLGKMIGADLGLQLESFATKLVETGRYTSKSEALREDIRLIQEREARLAVLDQALARGLAEVGRTAPAAEVFGRLAAKHEARASPEDHRHRRGRLGGHWRLDRPRQPATLLRNLLRSCLELTRFPRPGHRFPAIAKRESAAGRMGAI